MIQIDMEKPSACRWTDEENNIHLCPFLDREYDCLLQGHIGYWSWDGQYKDCPLHEVAADPDTVSRPTGYWMRMSDLNESEDDRYKCSRCGNVVHHRDKVFLYTYNSWCGACGANMNAKNYAEQICGAKMEVAVSEWEGEG